MGKGSKIGILFALPLVLSLAINSGEILIYLDSGVNLFNTPRNTSFWLILYRLSTTFLFCYLVLYLNIIKIDNWLKGIQKKYFIPGVVAINSILFLITIIPYIYIQDNFVYKLHEKEENGLIFVWLILLVICILSASIIKLKSSIETNLKNEPQFVRFNEESQSFKHDFEGLERNYLTSLLLPRNKLLEPVDITDFALFFIDEGIVKGITFKSRIYFIDKSIQELESNVNPNTFFRTNRQFLVNRSAVKHIEPETYGKISLALKINHKDIIISKLKAKQFKSWLTGSPD